MRRGSLHTRNFRRLNLSAFRYRWIKNGFTGPKGFRGFRETDPRRQPVRCNATRNATRNLFLIKNPAGKKIIKLTDNKWIKNFTNRPVLPCWVILITVYHEWPEILPRVSKSRRSQIFDVTGVRLLTRSCICLFTPSFDATSPITWFIRTVASLSPKAHKKNKTVDKLSLFNFPYTRHWLVWLAAVPVFYIFFYQ